MPGVEVRGPAGDGIDQVRHEVLWASRPIPFRLLEVPLDGQPGRVRALEPEPLRGPRQARVEGAWQADSEVSLHIRPPGEDALQHTASALRGQRRFYAEWFTGSLWGRSCGTEARTPPRPFDSQRIERETTPGGLREGSMA